ncbi:MAG: hypothetical protein JSS62_02090 [Verrucomicrobia bacterium]|nr:hypothetical protein [Verrucomicrobiota bacterium]MBS0645606.1 hypothetical protein [Verrucomicrobiota bacterium]
MWKENNKPAFEVGHRLQFQCQQCEQPILFSVLNKQGFSEVLTCSCCGQHYRFDDATLVRQLGLFEALCRQIHASQEILGKTAIAMDVGTHHVKVPFNLLMTRLSSVLELKINGKTTEIIFRIEPVKDVSEVLCLAD